MDTDLYLLEKMHTAVVLCNCAGSSNMSILRGSPGLLPQPQRPWRPWNLPPFLALSPTCSSIREPHTLYKRVTARTCHAPSTPVPLHMQISLWLIRKTLIHPWNPKLPPLGPRNFIWPTSHHLKPNPSLICMLSHFNFCTYHIAL